MKYLLSCKCGQSVEVEPGQAGQKVVCACGENLIVPSMLQVKALPVVTEKPKPLPPIKHVPYKAARVTLILGITCLFLWGIFWLTERGLFYVVFRGLTCAFLCSSIALAIRELAKSPLATDSAVRRTFFVLGVALLFPTFLLASYWYEWQPHPRWVSLKRVYYSFGSDRKTLFQNSTQIPAEEHTILWMKDERIDQMMPIELHLYFQTLEQPTFSYNFQENYEAVKDTYRVWVTGNIILLLLSLLSITASFFMPRQTVVVTGWSGSDWQ